MEPDTLLPNQMPPVLDYNQNVYAQPQTVPIDPNAGMQEETFPIDTTGSFSIPLPPEIAANRASKAYYGMSGIINKPLQNVQDAIKAGDEDALRLEVSSHLDAMRSQDVMDKVLQIVNKEPLEVAPDFPITDSGIQIQELINNQKPTNPDSVLEDMFAYKYANSIYTVNNNPTKPKYTWLEEAMSIMPSEVQEDVDAAARAISRFQFSVKQNEDAKALLKAQGTVPFLFDLGKMLSQVYPELKLRGSVKGSGFFDGILLGSNLDEQRMRLFSLPGGEYETEYKRIMDHLKTDNPMAAVMFSSAMTDMTKDERLLNNIFSLAAPLEIGAVAGIFGRAFTRASSQATAKSLVRSSFRTEAENPSVTAASGVGDLTEAAVQKTSVVIQERLAGAPNETKRAIESLTSNFQVDKRNVSINPARDGQGIVNEIVGMIEAGSNSLMNAFLTWNRINRTPVATTSEDIARTLREEIRIQAKGIDNAVLDVKGDTRGLPIHEPISNTHYFEVNIGTPEKEFFSKRSEALANAKQNGLIIRPTVSQRIADINREIGAINKSLRETPAVKPVTTGLQFFKGDVDPYKLGVTATRKAPPEAANVNVGPKEQARIDLRAERDALVKQFPMANEHVNTPLPYSEGFDVVSKDSGAGWYIRMHKFIPETGDTVRDSLITTRFAAIGAYKTMLFGPEVSTVMPPSRLGNFVNAFFSFKKAGSIRTPEEFLSKQERHARFDATFTPGKIAEFVTENKSYLDALHPGYHPDFKRILTFAQHELDPVTGKPGWFKRNPGEVQDWYMNYIGRPADRSEIMAYFEFKKLIEFDRIFREAANFRNKARNGVESHRVVLKTPEGEEAKTAFFDGIRQNHFPGGKDDVIMVTNEVMGKEVRHFADAFPVELKKDLVERIKIGELKVTRVWDPESMPLSELGGLYENSKIRYVISKNFETKPISWNSVNRTGAGHLMPEYGFYVKQGIVHNETIGGRFTNTYHGDATFFPVATKELGDEVVAAMERVRVHMKNGDEAAAKAAHDASPELPFSWEKHKSWYEKSRTPEGKTLPPRINPDLPFRTVSKNAKINDIDSSLQQKYDYVDAAGNMNNSFRDGTKSGSDARMSAIEFTGERDAYDLHTIERSGSPFNPVYKHMPVEYVDPISAMDRGLSRVINTTVMDDYKYYSMEHWLQEARELNALKADVTELRSAPLYHFHDPDPYVPNLDPIVRQNLENIRKAAKDFMGIGSDHDNFGQRIAQAAADAIYKVTGSSRFSVLPMNMWANSPNPSHVVRSVALHNDMGLLNVPSFFTQFSTAGNIFAISPRHATGGMLASALYVPSRFNKSEKMLDHLDKMATTWNVGGAAFDFLRVGWKPGWFKEATALLDANGFALVGHEHAFMSSPVNMSVFGSAWKKGLDFGMVPFKLGAQNTRVTSYYTAYLEWRNQNPLKAMTREDGELIRSRAGLLDHNMNRGSNSILHSGKEAGGVQSIVFQFAAYNMRLAEMMFGKRLTPMEKVRMVAMNSLLYGVPTGAVGLTGIPVVGWIRDQAINGQINIPLTGKKIPLGFNYIPGDNYVSSTVMEGGLASLTAFLLADPNSKQNKHWYNFAKWGPGKGIEQFSDVLWSDKTFLDVFGGASYSKYKDIVQFSTGARKAVASMFMADGDMKAWTGTSRDLVDMARIAASGNKAMQAYLAYTTGKWTAKNEQPVMDITPVNAMIISGLGLSPTAYLDMFDKQQIMKLAEQANRKAQDLFVKNMRRFANETDKPTQLIHWNNAWASLYMADFPPDQYGAALKAAAEGHENKLNKVDWDFFSKKVPANKDMQEQMKALGRTRELQGK